MFFYKVMQSVIKNHELKKGFSKYCHGGKLRDNINIKMSVKWVLYILMSYGII